MPTSLAQFNKFQRYRPPFTDDDGSIDSLPPDYDQPLIGTGFSPDTARDAHPVPQAEITPSNDRNALDSGAGKVPATQAPPPSALPPHAMSVPEGTDAGMGSSEEPEGSEVDQGGAPVMAAPAPMRGSAADIARQKLLKLDSPELQDPKRPKNNVWQTIGQTVLGMSRFGPEGAEAIIHPKYTAERQRVAEQRAQLGKGIDLAKKVAEEDRLTQKDKLASEDRLLGIQATAQARKDATDARELAKRQDLLKLEKDGVRRISADTPPLTPEQIAAGIQDREDVYGDSRFRMRVETQHGMIPVTDPALAKRMGVKVNTPVPIDKYFDLLGKFDATDNKEGKPHLTGADRVYMKSAGGDPDKEETWTPEVTKKFETIRKERPITVNASSAEAALDRELAHYSKPHEKAFADANTQLDKIEDAAIMVRGGAIDQALGIPKVLTALITGPGSGVRITKSELESIAHARGVLGDVEGTVRAWLGKGKLTTDQQQKLGSILEAVKQRVIQKRQIATDSLDSFGEASSRQQMIAADKAARKRILDMEEGAGGGTNTATLPGGITLDDINKELQKRKEGKK